MSFEEVTIGDCRLIRADCMEVLPTLGIVDAVVTDPPYGIGFKYNTHNDTRDGYEEWCKGWFAAIKKISSTIFMSPGFANVAMWARIEPFSGMCAWLKPASMGRSTFGFCNWEPMLLWGKATGRSVDVFSAPIIPDSDLDGHPCPKPLRWGTESVCRVSEPSETVLDPFMGSGTVGVGCVRTGRKFIGIEKDPEYFSIACRRIEEAYGKGTFFDDTKKREPELFAMT
jgi:DNA modification methylase